MKKILFGVILCLCSTFSFAEDRITFTTETIEKQRYEIMFSQSIEAHSFLIDKYTGTVYQMLHSGRSIYWQKLNFVNNNDKPCIDVSKSTYCRFQFIISCDIVPDMYLLDTQNGDTWQVVKNSSEILYLQKIKR